MIRKTLAGTASLIALPALAHHSDAQLDMSTVLSMEGVVKEFSLRNPHGYFVFEVRDENGQAREWTVQMASMITLTRRGWSRDSLQVGDRISVDLRPARDGRPYGLMATVEKDGVPIGSRRPRELQAGALDSQPRATSIAGRWLADRASFGPDYPGGLDQLSLRDMTLTPAGAAARSGWSQNNDDNPELDCITKPTPAMLVYTDLYPIEITDNGDQTLTIRSQYFDQVRTIYMDGRPHPDASELIHEGHSVGRYEGDTLVIDTRNFAYHRSPYQNGIPSSPQKHVIERYRLIDDGARLEVAFVVEDPQYIQGNWTHERALLYRPDTDMSAFDCDLESTRRFLPSNLAR